MGDATASDAVIASVHRTRRKLLTPRLPRATWDALETPHAGEAALATCVSLTQMYIAVVLAPRCGWAVLGALAYTVGALLSHMTFLALHESAHDAMLGGAVGAPLMRWVVQAPLVLPIASKFRKFHLAHHAYLSTPRDPDEPSPWEEAVFLRAPLGRAVWMCTQFVWYLLRPVLIAPQPSRWDAEDSACVAAQAVVLAAAAAGMAAVHAPLDAAAWCATAGAAVAYLALSVACAMGPSPFAAHFLIEHRPSSVSTRGGAAAGTATPPPPPSAASPTSGAGDAHVLTPRLPTPSTFNWSNAMDAVSYYVGYHVQHHDFPNVPGWRLPALHAALAPAYADIPVVTSWLAAMRDFVVTPYTKSCDAVRDAAAGVALVD